MTVVKAITTLYFAHHDIVGYTTFTDRFYKQNIERALFDIIHAQPEEIAALQNLVTQPSANFQYYTMLYKLWYAVAVPTKKSIANMLQQAHQYEINHRLCEAIEEFFKKKYGTE